MDALVRAFTSEGDVVVVAADEGDVVDDGEGDAGNVDGVDNHGDSDASDAPEDDPEDAVSDMSN